ncbi:MAG: hypothetical protein A2144_11285 [Chloroflexi bacterium RBG_16_50_9]|nr:MAG: hypothetical protein A2144_11285 [Chloroflexi bacterium RBG_16_50_9]
MGENQKRILQMLAEGKISAEEASRLLSLVGEETNRGDDEGAMKKDKPSPKYLYVRVEPKEGQRHGSAHEGFHSLAKHGRVNIRIPVGLIRAGMKLKALIPPGVADDVNKALKEKGMSFDIHNLKDEYVDELIRALSETEINVDSEEAEVRVYAE